MAYTLLQLRQALAEEAFSGEFPIRILTTAAGSSTSVVIAGLAFGASGATTNEYHGCWIYNTLAAPTAPFSSRVLEQGGFAPTTGTLTVAPAFGGTGPGTACEVIFCYDLHPDELHLAINRILRNLIYYAYLPVTLVDDGDLEEAGASDWTAVSGGAATKNPSLNMAFGRQILVVTTTGVSSGVTSNSIKVRAGETLLVSVPVRVSTTGSGQVVLRNVTAGSDIKAVTVDEDFPATVQFTADVPSGCEAVAIRFLGATAGTPAMNVGPVTVLSQNRKRYSLDSGSIERSADIKDLFKIPQGQSAVASDSFYSFSDFNPDSDFLVEEDVRAGSPMNIVLPTFPTQPYFMRVQKRFPELAVTAALINASTNTTLADRDTVVQGAMHYIERARYARVAASKPDLAAVHLGRSREYAQKFARMRQAQGYGIVVREIPQARTTVAMS